MVKMVVAGHLPHYVGLSIVLALQFQKNLHLPTISCKEAPAPDASTACGKAGQ